MMIKGKCGDSVSYSLDADTDRVNKTLGEIVEGIKHAERTSTFIVEAPED